MDMTFSVWLLDVFPVVCTTDVCPAGIESPAKSAGAVNEGMGTVVVAAWAQAVVSMQARSCLPSSVACVLTSACAPTRKVFYAKESGSGWIWQETYEM